MASSSSEEAVREEKIATMGEELGTLHFHLWKDLTWLHLEWSQFKEFFGTHQSRIDVMNKTAHRFFWSLERVLWQDTLLGLSRLSDPPGTGGQQNLTLRRLPGLVANQSLRERVESALETFEARTSFARDWRHRRYAHRDLAHATNAGARPLEHASRASVEAGLGAARELMNILELHYHGSEVAYQHSHDGGGGARALLWHLDLGLHAIEQAPPDRPRWRPRFT